MPLDHHTLLDLDVLSTTAPEGQTVLALVDRSRSRAGLEHLKRRLANPATTAKEVEDLQQAHRAIGSRLASYAGHLANADLDATERYLDSKWEVPRARAWYRRTLSALWLSLGYSAYLREVERGRNRVLVLLHTASALREVMAESESARLRALAGELSAQIDAEASAQLLRLGRRRSGAALIAFDQVARGDARRGLREVVDLLGQVDALCSVAAATSEHGWCWPTVGTQLRIVGLVHPFLEGSAIPNDLDLGPDVRVCFLTGPNMAGKSTFLKATGVAALLAHIGAGVPAAAMQFVPVPALFSSVQISDNIAAGESFFLAEVRRIRTLAKTLRESGAALVVIDEPFRGTNVHDAAEATVAVLMRLADHPGATAFVASHIGEIAAQLGQDPRICCLHFAADTSGQTPRFDFRLRDGVSTQRLGMTLLRQEGVLEMLEMRPAD